MQIITLSTDLVIDGCKLHLNGTKIMINRTANNNPTITIENGGELLPTEGGGDGEQTENVHLNPGRGLDAVGIEQAFAEHLVAAAPPDDRASRRPRHLGRRAAGRP